MKSDIKYIEKIKVKGFWGKHDIEWNLNSDVNILIGINGSGKTTLLKLILAIVNQDSAFIDKQSTNYESLFKGRWLGFIEKDGFGNNVYIDKPNSKNWQVIINHIDTFDSDLKNQEAIQKLSNDKVKTSLDWELWQLEKYYLNYQITLGKRIEKVVFESLGDDFKEKRDEIYGKKNLFIATINRFFSKTNKLIDSDEKDNSIVFRKGNLIITPYQLSSGEKQVLIILLKTLLQDNQPSILLLDEPEISLHLEWQHQLIDCIRALNENCQVIIATHSPSIFSKGWYDKIVRMEDIVKLNVDIDDELPF